MKLRDGVVFHDGKPVTADDVVYSYQAHHRPEETRRWAPASSPMLPTSGIRKVDADTVEFHLDTPNAIFDEALALYGNCIVPQGFDPKKPIGTGPFKLKSFDKPGQQIVFDANKEYWGEARTSTS